MDSFLLLRRLVAAIVFKGQTVSDYWWSRRTIFLTFLTLRIGKICNFYPSPTAGTFSMPTSYQ